MKTIIMKAEGIETEVKVESLLGITERTEVLPFSSVTRHKPMTLTITGISPMLSDGVLKGFKLEIAEENDRTEYHSISWFEGKIKEVVDRPMRRNEIFERIQAELYSSDLSRLPGGGVRAQNMMTIALRRLREEGALKNISKGVWAPAQK